MFNHVIPFITNLGLIRITNILVGVFLKVYSLKNNWVNYNIMQLYTCMTQQHDTSNQKSEASGLWAQFLPCRPIPETCRTKLNKHQKLILSMNNKLSIITLKSPPYDELTAMCRVGWKATAEIWASLSIRRYASTSFSNIYKGTSRSKFSKKR